MSVIGISYIFFRKILRCTNWTLVGTRVDSGSLACNIQLRMNDSKIDKKKGDLDNFTLFWVAL